VAKLCWCQIRSPDSAHKPKQVTLIKKCTEVPQSPLLLCNFVAVTPVMWLFLFDDFCPKGWLEWILLFMSRIKKII
jgi:hypothetical protein